jgi:hypothetical protein
MAKKQYQVAVDSWGSNPEFLRGRVIELDLDDKDAMSVFPYDARWALDQGILIDMDAQAAEIKAKAEADARLAEENDPGAPPPPAPAPDRGTSQGRNRS